MKPETFQQLKNYHSDISYLQRKLKRMEEEVTKFVAKELKLEGEFPLVATMAQFIADNEERIEREAEEEKIAALSKEADAKNKTLKRLSDKARELGLGFQPRPDVGFGTTEDRTFRIVAMNTADKDGIMWALIWSGGASWSDNGGQHYGESSLDIRPVYYERGKLREGRRGGSGNVIRGGKLTIKRLEEVKDKIRKFIPNYEPALMPWEYTLIYPDITKYE